MPPQFKGAAKHLKRLQNLRGARVRREAGALVERLADEHVTEAAFLITEGSVSGKNHVASKPYEPPNADTGELDRSGHVRRTGPLSADSVFDAGHAADLEFGADGLIERPFARPAAKKVRRKVARIAKEAVERLVSGRSILGFSRRP